MKKSFKILLFSLAVPMVLSGCKGSASDNENKKILVESEWEHFNAYIGQTESITFNKNNEFFYSDSSGEPIGDSDLYDTYSYNAKDQITLKASYDDGPDDLTLKILYMDDMTLLLDMGDDIVEFYNAEDRKSVV